MKVSIVMTYYNRQAQLNKTLESFKDYNPKDFNVIIVDDGSDEPIDLTEKYDFDIKILRITNKIWIQGDPSWNTGFFYALQSCPDVVILQNAECYHVGDVLGYAQTVTDKTYISFGCFSLNELETFREHDIHDLLRRNDFICSHDGDLAWYNHPKHRPYAYHFCAAITAKNLVKLNGFDERFSFALAFDDDYFLHQVKCLGLKVEITEKPFVVHQWHYSKINPDKNKLWDVNRELFNELKKEKNYRAKHVLTYDLMENWDYIQGDKFQALAKWVFSPSIKWFPDDDYRSLVNTLNLKFLQDYDIVYTHTFYVKDFFEVIKRTDKKVILISHSCDSNIDETYLIPDNIVKWYSHTFKINDPRCVRVPLGLENNRRDFGVKKKEKMTAKLRERKNTINPVYINFLPDTNPEKRGNVYSYFEDKEFATVKHGCGFDEYLNDIYNHDFVISPEGSGMECHRTWEALYMGSIPIEIRNINNEQLYEDLPICLIDDWNDITLDFLIDELIRIKSGNWSLEKLNFKYWKNIILNDTLSYMGNK
jgi:glycosyltransferase involved in cell wall biosynthesis